MAVDSRPHTGHRTVLAIVSIGVLLSSLDLFIVNVALPDLARELGTAELSDLSWVLNAYALVFAALLIPAGRFGDRNGNRIAFLLGLGLFVLGSALCAVAWNTDALIGFRVVQAIGCAVLMPSSLGLVLAVTPQESRAAAIRIWVAVGGLGAALGPVAGGLLVELDWRWVFLVNVPIGLAALIAGIRLLPEVPKTGGALPDLRGAALLAGSVATLILALVKGPDWGWTSAGVLGSAGVAVLLGSGFVVSSQRHGNPLLDPAVLRAPNFVVAGLNSIAFQVAFAAMLLSFVLWVQDVWGWSALQAGLAIAPGPFLVPPVAILAGRLIARVGPGPVIAGGGVVFAVGVLWWTQTTTSTPDYVGGLLGGILLTGVGVGLTLPTAFAVGAGGLAPQHFGTGSAVLSTARQVGLALGVAILVAALGTPAPAEVVDAFHRAWYVTAVAALLAGLLGLAVHSPAPATSEPAAESDHLR